MLKMDVARALLSRCEAEIKNYREHRWQSGAEFNVFKIVRRDTDEVYGHSAFVAELLNPSGSHGQGSTYLKLFFEILGVQKEVQGIERWRVSVEDSQGVDGRIDILLDGHGDCGRRFVIAIENKIYAGDQDRQLYRYWQYLVKKCGYRWTGTDEKLPYRLCYLTLHGERPSDKSLGDIPKIELAFEDETNSNASVQLLSYANHVAEWIKLCHEKSASYSYVREVMAQYLDTINTLTGSGGGMTDSLQKLLDTPDKLFAAAKLSDVVDDFKKTLVCTLWDMIQAEWQQRSSKDGGALRGVLEGNRWLGGGINMLHVKTKERLSSTRNSRWFGLVAKGYSFKGIPVGIEIRFEDGFYVGLYGENEEECIDVAALRKFRDGFTMPIGCKLSPLDDKVSQGRIYITVEPGNFFEDSLELFKLIDSSEKEKFVNVLLDQAEGIVKGMEPYGLTYRS